MKYIFDNDLHIHSKISLCSNDPNQTNERILQYVKDNGLHTICITDHFWDENVAGASEWYMLQNFQHISMAKPLPQADGIRFLFGCEAEMDKYMNISVSEQRYDEFDFIVIPTTHFHMTDFTIPKSMVSPAQKAEFWLEKFNALLDKDLPFRKIGVAHLTCPLIDRSRENYLAMISLLDSKSLENVFERVAKRGAGIELNLGDMKFSDEEADTVLRPYRIAKQVGCKFYMGSDAHHPADFDIAKSVFERVIDLLDLTEDDKFVIKK